MSTISRTSDEKKSLATDQSRDARGVPAHSYSREETLAANLSLWARERARVDERFVRAARVVRTDGATEPLGEVHVQLGAAVEVQDDDRCAYESERVLWREAKRGGGCALLRRRCQGPSHRLRRLRGVVYCVDCVACAAYTSCNEDRRGGARMLLRQCRPEASTPSVRWNRNWVLQRLRRGLPPDAAMTRWPDGTSVAGQGGAGEDR